MKPIFGEDVKKILVTGGGGYIGSHTCLALLRLEHKVFVIDNLCNGHIEALNRVQRLSNRRLDFRKCDVRDAKVINSIFEQFDYLIF